MAAWPRLFRMSWASGSVVDWWVALLRGSPRKSTVGLPGSSSVEGVGWFFGRTLLWLAQASRRVPSTVKCSAETRLAWRAWTSTAAKKAWAMPPLEEPVPVLGEHGRIPDGVVNAEANEPPEQEIVGELLHGLAFAPDAIEGLQEQGPEELLRQDRGAARVGVEQRKTRREGLQGLIDHGPDRAQGMVLRDSLLRLDVAPHVALLGIAAAYRAPPRKC